MATTFSLSAGARGSSIWTIGTLASANYAVSSAIDLTATIPSDVTFEFAIDPNGTPTGNMQLLVFAILSIDGTNYSSGPTSSTARTNEADLYQLGAVPCNDTSTHTRMFSIAELPVVRYLKLVAFNDMGVALTSGAVYQSVINNVGT